MKENRTVFSKMEVRRKLILIHKSSFYKLCSLMSIAIDPLCLGQVKLKSEAANPCLRVPAGTLDITKWVPPVSLKGSLCTLTSSSSRKPLLWLSSISRISEWLGSSAEALLALFCNIKPCERIYYAYSSTSLSQGSLNILLMSSTSKPKRLAAKVKNSYIFALSTT